jgi:O-antigen/teichoic acid export membrane protein
MENENLSRIAVKGSVYNLVSLLILKFGGLIFTIILARMLLPELFGIYALALSIATLAMVFTDWGMENTFLRHLSESIGEKNKEKSRAFTRYFFKARFFLIIAVILVLTIVSKYLSYNIYKQPLLFYPLIFSCLFILAESFRTFFVILFTAKKDMKSIVFLDVSFQILKILFSVFVILTLSDKIKISGIFLAFFASSLLTLFLEVFILTKKHKELLFGKKSSINKTQVNTYWKFMALATISLSIFGSVDTLMLGKFVASEYLAYYRAALSLVITISSLLSLSSIFLPIFTQIKNQRFERGFKKTFRYLMIFSIPATAGVIFLSNYLIKVVYGNQYLLGTSSLYFLSILIITTPLIGFYSTILQSKEKSKIIGNSILVSLIFNIILNLIMIKIFIGNPLSMIAGVGFATSLSRVFLLALLIFYSKKEFNLKIKGIGLRSPVFATLIMVIFLFLFNYFIDINILFGIIEVIFGAGIYLGVLILSKGVTKEDFDLIKGLFKRK